MTEKKEIGMEKLIRYLLESKGEEYKEEYYEWYRDVELEQLLNILIQRGWKPFNVDCAWTNVEVINKINDNRYIPEHSKIIFKTETHWHVFDCNIRDLVSKSSGLWQFVCENGMVKKPDIDRGEVYNWDNPNHWLCESALKYESELEQFLLDNIKVEG